MPKEFKALFKQGKVTAHVRRKKNGVYEVRCMIRGVSYTGSSKDLAEAKARFIESLGRAAEEHTKKPREVPGLKEYMEEWLLLAKEPDVKGNTMEQYRAACRNHIEPALGAWRLDELPAFEVQGFFNRLEASEPSLTDMCYHLLKSCLEYAVADGLIARNPMARMKKPRYRPKEARALTREEEAVLLSDLKPSSVSSQACVLMLYTGIRLSEVATAYLTDDGFVSVVCAKGRKGEPPKRRDIPVCPMLARVIQFLDFEAIRALKPSAIEYRFKLVFPSHHVHELRHTFITRAQECGVPRSYVSLWAGHAADSSVTSQVYTHLGQDRELQRREVAKINYTL